MKQWLPSWNIMRMPIKSKIRIYFVTVIISIVKTVKVNNCWWGCKQREPLYALVGLSISIVNVNNSVQVSNQLQKDLAHDSDLPLLDICPEEMKSAHEETSAFPCLLQYCSQCAVNLRDHLWMSDWANVTHTTRRTRYNHCEDRHPRGFSVKVNKVAGTRQAPCISLKHWPHEAE